MHVPAAIVEGDKADAGVAQAPGRQQLLSQAGTVTIAHPRVFPRHVKGLAGPALDQFECLGLEAVQALKQAAAIEAPVERRRSS